MYKPTHQFVHGAHFCRNHLTDKMSHYCCKIENPSDMITQQASYIAIIFKIKHYKVPKSAVKANKNSSCESYFCCYFGATKFPCLFAFSLLKFHTEYAWFLISWVPWYTTVIRLSVKTRWLVAKMGKSPGKISDESPVWFCCCGSTNDYGIRMQLCSTLY